MREWRGNGDFIKSPSFSPRRLSYLQKAAIARGNIFCCLSPFFRHRQALSMAYSIMSNKASRNYETFSTLFVLKLEFLKNRTFKLFWTFLSLYSPFRHFLICRQAFLFARSRQPLIIRHWQTMIAIVCHLARDRHYCIWRCKQITITAAGFFSPSALIAINFLFALPCPQTLISVAYHLALRDRLPR